MHIAAYWAYVCSVEYAGKKEKVISGKIIQLLLERGADPLHKIVRNGEFLTPYEYAIALHRPLPGKEFQFLPYTPELKPIKEKEKTVLKEKRPDEGLARAIAQLVYRNQAYQKEYDYKPLFIDLMELPNHYLNISFDELAKEFPQKYAATWHLINKYMMELYPSGNNFIKTDSMKANILYSNEEKRAHLVKQGSSFLVWKKMPSSGNLKAEDDQQIFKITGLTQKDEPKLNQLLKKNSFYATSAIPKSGKFQAQDDQINLAKMTVNRTFS